MLCPYVVTKREAEQAVLAEVAQGLDATIVNPAYMIGPWDWKPSSGRMLLEVARNRGLVAPLGTNNFCDVRDVAQGILAAADRGAAGRRYILGGERLTYFQAWRIFAKVTRAIPPLLPAGPLVRRAAGRCGDLWTRLTGREPDVNSAATAMAAQSRNFVSTRAERELDYQRPPVVRGGRSRLAVVSGAPLRLRVAIMVFACRTVAASTGAMAILVAAEHLAPHGREFGVHHRSHYAIDRTLGGRRPLATGGAGRRAPPWPRNVPSCARRKGSAKKASHLYAAKKYRRKLAMPPARPRRRWANWRRARRRPWPSRWPPCARACRKSTISLKREKIELPDLPPAVLSAKAGKKQAAADGQDQLYQAGGACLCQPLRQLPRATYARQSFDGFVCAN